MVVQSPPESTVAVRVNDLLAGLESATDTTTTCPAASPVEEPEITTLPSSWALIRLSNSKEASIVTVGLTVSTLNSACAV